MSKLTDLLKGRVQFLRFDHRDGQDPALWYQVFQQVYTGPPREVFTFPVPLHETLGAEWLADDRAAIFQRWIKRHLEFLEAARVSEVPG